MNSNFVSICLCAIIVLTIQVNSQDDDGAKPSQNYKEMSPSEILKSRRIQLESLGKGDESTPIHIPFYSQYFNFTHTDWKIVHFSSGIEENQQARLMLMSISKDLEKNLTIELTPPAKTSSFKLSYKYYVSKGQNNSADAKLQVFLELSNGKKILKKEEKASESWMKSSIEFNEEDIVKIIFNGNLKAEKNELGLRFVVIENIPPVAIEESLNPVVDPTDTEDLPTPLPDSKDIEKEKDLLPLHEPTTKRITDLNDYNNDVYNMKPIIVITTQATEKITSGTAEESGDVPSNTDSPTLVGNDDNEEAILPFLTENEEVSTSTNNSTKLSTNSDYRTHHVLNFFIVVIILSALIIMVLMWRKKITKKEDEIPVFHRSNEHRNEAYTDADDELDVTGPSNHYSTIR